MSTDKSRIWSPVRKQETNKQYWRGICPCCIHQVTHVLQSIYLPLCIACGTHFLCIVLNPLYVVLMLARVICILKMVPNHNSVLDMMHFIQASYFSPVHGTYNITLTMGSCIITFNSKIAPCNLISFRLH